MNVFLRFLFILLLSSLVWCEEDSVSLEVETIDEGVDRGDIWVGVFSGDLNSSVEPGGWIHQTANEFSLSIPANQDKSTLVFLRKDFVPIVVPLTAELMEAGIDLEFSEGIVVAGTVTSGANEAIAEGMVSLGNFHDFKFTLPDPSLSVWEVEEDGSYEIRGLQPGFYTVTAAAPEFMRANAEVELLESDRSRELNFSLLRAEYISGRVVDRYGDIVRGRITAEVTPSASQTEDIHTEFDRDDNFRIGPFTEGVTVVLTARDTDIRRSHAREFQVPQEGVELVLHSWIPLTGVLKDSDTDEPVEYFKFWTASELGGQWPIEVFAPNGQLELEIDSVTLVINIVAQGYLWWGISQLELESKESFDLGTIRLEPAHTVRGRVIESSTGAPLAGATLRSIVVHDGNVSIWDYNNVVTTTDTQGEFALQGVSSTGGVLEVYAENYQLVSVAFEDPELYQEIELSLDRDEMGSLSGQVVSLEGEPVYPAWVSLGGRGARTKEDGSSVFLSLVGTGLLLRRRVASLKSWKGRWHLGNTLPTSRWF